jgi:hypothetical protein
VIVSWCYSKTQIWHQHAPLPFSLPSVRRKKLTIDFAGGNQSSNGGLLLLREAERKHCRRLAEAMPDRRDPDHVRHVRDGDVACFGDRLRARRGSPRLGALDRGHERSRPARARGAATAIGTDISQWLGVTGLLLSSLFILILVAA